MGRRVLTRRQQQVLGFIRDQEWLYGAVPTLREIAEACSTGTIQGARSHVKALERKGYLTREPRKQRGLSVVPQPGETVKVLGRVT